MFAFLTTVTHTKPPITATKQCSSKRLLGIVGFALFRSHFIHFPLSYVVLTVASQCVACLCFSLSALSSQNTFVLCSLIYFIIIISFLYFIFLFAFYSVDSPVNSVVFIRECKIELHLFIFGIYFISIEFNSSCSSKKVFYSANFLLFSSKNTKKKNIKSKINKCFLVSVQIKQFFNSSLIL